MTAQTDWVQSSVTDDLSYPAAPWHMVGSLWLTLFRLRDPADDLRPAGIYGAAFVSYEQGSPLTYSELLVARPVATDEHGRRVTITDIWVDSPASVAGGRELWAIPKGLCDFSFESAHAGPLTTTEWTARLGRTPIARARMWLIGWPSASSGRWKDTANESPACEKARPSWRANAARRTWS